MIIGNYEKFCKDYHLCEGYEKALNSSEDYFLHHIQGENISKEELIENDLYYDCQPSELRFVTKVEHMGIHMTGKFNGENHPFFGKTPSDETRKKLSEAKRGENNPNFGKKHSVETCRKISEANTGRTPWNKGLKGKTSPNKGMSWKLVDGKRIYYKKYDQLALELG